jgi:arsenate reductase-like glutaredoxin family protein
MVLTIYRVDNCETCEALIAYLEKNGIDYKIIELKEY